MGFEWDPNKEAANKTKHDIAFEDAIKVFRDPALITEESSRPEHGESRWQSTGMLGPDYVTVIFTVRGDKRRVISARRASKDEREQYRTSSASA